MENLNSQNQNQESQIISTPVPPLNEINSVPAPSGHNYAYIGLSSLFVLGSLVTIHSVIFRESLSMFMATFYLLISWLSARFIFYIHDRVRRTMALNSKTQSDYSIVYFISPLIISPVLIFLPHLLFSLCFGPNILGFLCEASIIEILALASLIISPLYLWIVGSKISNKVIKILVYFLPGILLFSFQFFTVAYYIFNATILY